MFETTASPQPRVAVMDRMSAASTYMACFKKARGAIPFMERCKRGLATASFHAWSMPSGTTLGLDMTATVARMEFYLELEPPVGPPRSAQISERGLDQIKKLSESPWSVYMRQLRLHGWSHCMHVPPPTTNEREAQEAVPLPKGHGFLVAQ